MKANAGKYDTFHIKLQNTIFGKKLNRVSCLYWVGVPCLYRHVEYYSMSDSPIFGKGQKILGITKPRTGLSGIISESGLQKSSGPSSLWMLNTKSTISQKLNIASKKLNN